MTTIERLTALLADRYRIERELGQGGMATVYLAHDLRHDRDVAIKVLHPDLGAALGGDRFLTEIRTTARLQHPHILPLLDSGEADGLLYYVMPLVTGETLRARLDRERQLPVDDAVRIAREVADALAHAHGLGVIHRDIKPENILLQGGHALVADFGIALAVQTAGGQRMTQTGLSLGTPQYMSPEQAMGERVIDARSDVYALGAVTYEMLVGEPPFTGPTVQSIVARLISEEPRGIATQRKAVADHVEAAVLRALEKLPADRFASAAEFATALRDGSMTTAIPAHRRTTAHRADARTLSRVPKVAAWLTLVIAGAIVGWLLPRPSSQDAATSDPFTVTSILPPAGGNFGEQRALALSPDGQRLAFVFAAIDGSRMLWLRHLDRLDTEPLPRTVGAQAPFWSPDGRSIGFFAGGYLTVLDANGETRRLCPASGATGGSWNAAGVILFGHRGGISKVPATGGTCVVIIPRTEGPVFRGIFLPDGERFLYSRGRGLSIVAADINGTLLDTLPVNAVEFAVVGSGYLIVPSRTDTRAIDAQRIDLRSLTLDGPVVRVATDVRSQAGVHTFTVSASGAFAFLPGSADQPYLEYNADGTLRDTIRVEGTWTLGVRPRGAGPPFVAIGGTGTGLWLYDLDTDRATRLLPRDTAFSSAQGPGTIWPSFSADGLRLVHAIARGARCRIVERNLATDIERVVMESSATAGQCPAVLDWSSDGRNILTRPDSGLQVITIDGAAGPRLARPGRLMDGRFSPDGRSVAYSSDETGRAEIYIQTLPSGQPMPISTEGGRWPNWSHAGRRLTFMTPNGRVQEIDIDGSANATPRTRFSVPTWRRSTFDDGGSGFAVVGDSERYIVRVSPAGVAVAYVNRWQTLMNNEDSIGRARK